MPRVRIAIETEFDHPSIRKSDLIRTLVKIAKDHQVPCDTLYDYPLNEKLGDLKPDAIDLLILQNFTHVPKKTGIILVINDVAPPKTNNVVHMTPQEVTNIINAYLFKISDNYKNPEIMHSNPLIDYLSCAIIFREKQVENRTHFYWISGYLLTTSIILLLAFDRMRRK